MPLTGSDAVLSAALRAAILADGSIGGIDGPALTGLCDAISSTILAHIVANALVMPALLVAPPGGGPVTGTGTIA